MPLPDATITTLLFQEGGKKSCLSTPYASAEIRIGSGFIEITVTDGNGRVDIGGVTIAIAGANKENAGALQAYIFDKDLWDKQLTKAPQVLQLATADQIKQAENESSELGRTERDMKEAGKKLFENRQKRAAAKVVKP